MRNSDNEYERQRLQRVVAETKEVAPKLIEKARNLTEAGQSALDLATCIEGLCATAPISFFQNPMLPYISGGLHEFNSVALRQCGQITEDENLAQIIHSSTTVTAVSTISAGFVSFGPKAEATPELKLMERLLRRGVDVARVQASMKVLGLDTAHGGSRSPVEQVRTAEEALKRPFADGGYATAVLIPLRESIEGTIEELLRRRQNAEKTGSWTKKVTSIARHCGKTSLSSEHVERVAETTRTLIDQLSGAKHRQMTRERIALFFDEGISLLQDIVSLIDMDKLRPITK